MKSPIMNDVEVEEEIVSTREQTTIRLPKDLKQKIYQQADQRSISFNAEIILLIRLGLKVQ